VLIVSFSLFIICTIFHVQWEAMLHCSDQLEFIGSHPIVTLCMWHHGMGWWILQWCLPASTEVALEAPTNSVSEDLSSNSSELWRGWYDVSLPLKAQTIPAKLGDASSLRGVLKMETYRTIGRLFWTVT
jgi:hypothetical protein